MYKTPEETTEFFNRFNEPAGEADGCDVVVFPPFLDIPAAVSAAKGTRTQIGGQDLHWAKEGAYTGDISAGLLISAGCGWVLVGHSERRLYHRETDADVLKKAQAAIEAGLKPIVCVGEKLEERESGKTEQVLLEQFGGGIAGLTAEQFGKIVIAYEPIWAIGTGHTATPKIAAEMHAMIRGEVSQRFGKQAAEAVRILYGGSVKPENIDGLRGEEDIDGGLGGGASLDAVSFHKLVQAAQTQTSEAKMLGR